MKRLWSLVASVLWTQVNRCARFALKQKWMKPTQLPTRVISVGNIQSGGAGKTPLVAQIAQEAHERGLSVCILSRGYRGAWEKKGGILAPAQKNIDPRWCGDEPALLHELCPDAWIGVGADRVRQYQQIVQRLNGDPDLVILDDGFQHWKLKRDLEVVAVTSDQPGSRIFRESWDALRFADLVVWTKGSQLPVELRRVLSSSLCRVSYDWALFAGEKNLQSDPQQKFWLITALADSQSAYDTAIQAGLQVVKHTPLMDHFQFSEKEVNQFLAQAHQSGVRIALTGKDWVKWRALGVQSSQVSVFEPELKWVFGREIWTRILWEKS